MKRRGNWFKKSTGPIDTAAKARVALGDFCGYLSKKHIQK